MVTFLFTTLTTRSWTCQSLLWHPSKGQIVTKFSKAIKKVRVLGEQKQEEMNWGSGVVKYITCTSKGQLSGKICCAGVFIHHIFFRLNKTCVHLHTRAVLTSSISKEKCCPAAVVVCHAQGTPPGFLNKVDWRLLVKLCILNIANLRW